MSDTPRQTDDRDEQFSALCDGTLDAAEFEALQRRLLSDREALRDFIRYADLHAEMATRSGVPIARARSASVDAAAPAGRIGPRRFVPLAIAASLMIAAACVALYLAVAGHDASDATTPPGEVVATITDLRGVRWTSDPRSTGDDVQAGDLRTAEGAVELMLAHGTMVQTDGAIDLRLEAPSRVMLSRGAATFTCPHDDKGFTVLTPRGARIVDLGTRFRVWVGDDGSTRVDVLEGVVEVAGPADAKAMKLVAGQFASIDTDDRAQAHDPFAGDVPLGALFDDAAGTPLDLAVASDTFQATAEVGDLGVVRVIQGGREPGASQTIADDVRIDLRPLGWTNVSAGRVPTHAAWSSNPGEGGIRTTGSRAAGNLPRHETGVGMHANLLLTIDLDALRRAGGIADAAAIRFVCERAGVNDTGLGTGAVHVAAIAFDDAGSAVAVINGRPVATETIAGTIRFTAAIPSAVRSASARFDLPIPTTARYLTLVAASAGGIESDHAVFSGARLVVEPADPNPAPVTPDTESPSEGVEE